MNDSMSILLATTVLALGGLGLYMFKLDKSSNSVDIDDTESYTEDGLFSGSDLFNWGTKSYDDKIEDEPIIEDDYDFDYEEEYKPKRRSNAKTHKNKKSYGNSKRRY